METTAKIWSDAELPALRADGNKREQPQGEITTNPAGWEHGYISIILAAGIERHAFRNRRGVRFDSSTGFRVTPEDLLSPDVAFVAKARLAGVTHGFFTSAPDLVIEVLSPSVTIERTHAKMARYFEHGTRLAWIINPSERNALVYRSLGADRLLRAADTLDGEDVLPGFRLPLTELFAELSFD